MDETVKEVRSLLESLKKNFQCMICLDLFSQPVSTKCNHQFCKNCFDELLKNKKKNRKASCPLCNTNVTKRSLQMQNAKLVEMVSAVRGLCNAADNDCEVLGVTPLLSQRHRTSTTKNKLANEKKDRRRNSLSFLDTSKEKENILDDSKQNKETNRKESPSFKLETSNNTAPDENPSNCKPATKRKRMSLCRSASSSKSKREKDHGTIDTRTSSKERVSLSIKRKTDNRDTSECIANDFTTTNNNIEITPNTKGKNKEENVQRENKTLSSKARKRRRVNYPVADNLQSRVQVSEPSEEMVRASVSTASSSEGEILPKVSKCFNKDDQEKTPAKLDEKTPTEAINNVDQKTSTKPINDVDEKSPTRPFNKHDTDIVNKIQNKSHDANKTYIIHEEANDNTIEKLSNVNTTKSTETIENNHLGKQAQNSSSKQKNNRSALNVSSNKRNSTSSDDVNKVKRNNKNNNNINNNDIDLSSNISKTNTSESSQNVTTVLSPVNANLVEELYNHQDEVTTKVTTTTTTTTTTTLYRSAGKLDSNSKQDDNLTTLKSTNELNQTQAENEDRDIRGRLQKQPVKQPETLIDQHTCKNGTSLCENMLIKHLSTKALIQQDSNAEPSEPFNTFRTPPKTNEKEKLKSLWESFESPNQDHTLFSNWPFSAGKLSKSKSMRPKRLTKSLATQEYVKSGEKTNPVSEDANPKSSDKNELVNNSEPFKEKETQSTTTHNKNVIDNDVELLKSPPTLQRKQQTSLRKTARASSENINSSSKSKDKELQSKTNNDVEILKSQPSLQRKQKNPRKTDRDSSINTNSNHNLVNSSFKAQQNVLQDKTENYVDIQRSSLTTQRMRHNSCKTYLESVDMYSNNHLDSSFKFKQKELQDKTNNDVDIMESPPNLQQNSRKTDYDGSINMRSNHHLQESPDKTDNDVDTLRSPPTSQRKQNKLCKTSCNSININSNNHIDSNFGSHSEDSVIPPTPDIPKKLRSVTGLSSTSNTIDKTSENVNRTSTDNKCETTKPIIPNNAESTHLKDIEKSVVELAEQHHQHLQNRQQQQHHHRQQKQQQQEQEQQQNQELQHRQEEDLSTPPLTESDKQLCDMVDMDDETNDNNDDEQPRNTDDDDVVLISVHDEDDGMNFEDFDDGGIDIYTNEKGSQQKKSQRKRVHEDVEQRQQQQQQGEADSNPIEEIMFLEPKEKIEQEKNKQELAKSSQQDQDLEKHLNDEKEHRDPMDDDYEEEEEERTIYFLAERSSVAEVLHPCSSKQKDTLFSKRDDLKLCLEDSFVNIDLYEHLDNLESSASKHQQTSTKNKEANPARNQSIATTAIATSPSKTKAPNDQITESPARKTSTKISNEPERDPEVVKSSATDDEEKIKRPSKHRKRKQSSVRSENMISTTKHKVPTITYGDNDGFKSNFSDSSDDEMFMKSALSKPKQLEKNTEDGSSKKTHRSTSPPRNIPSATSFIKDIQMLKEKLSSPIGGLEIDARRNRHSKDLFAPSVPVINRPPRTTESPRNTHTTELPKDTYTRELSRDTYTRELPRNTHTRESPIKISTKKSATNLDSDKSFKTPLKLRPFLKEISPTTPATILPIPVDHSTVLPSNELKQRLSQKKLNQDNCISTSSTSVQRYKQECSKKSSTSSTATTKTESAQVVPQKNITHQIPHTTVKSPNRCYPVVMTTRLNKKGQVFCKTAVARMGGKIVGEYSDEVTHLIVATDENNALSKDYYTFKYLMALVSGIWIVNLKWIASSFKNNKLLDETMYEAKGDPLFGQEHVPRHYRIQKQRKLTSLFKGYRFCLLGKFEESQIQKDQLMKLLYKLDADVACTLSEMLCSSSQVKTIVISDNLDNLNEDEIEVVSNYGCQTYHPDWIVECVINGRIEDTNNFCFDL